MAAPTVSIRRTNYATNPDMVTLTGATTTFRTNLVANPSFETGVSGVFKSTVLTLAQSNYAPMVASGSNAMTITVGTGAQINCYVYQDVDITASQYTAFAANVRYSSGSRYVKLAILWLDSGGSYTTTGSANAYSPIYQAPNGSSGGARYLVSGLAPTDAVKARLLLYFYDNAAGTVPVVDASVFSTDAWHAATGPTQSDAEWRVSSYFDGSSVDPSGDFTYTWSGTAHASTSNETGRNVSMQGYSAGTAGVGGCYQSSDAPPGASFSLKSIQTAASTGGSAGITYTTGSTLAGQTGQPVSGGLWVKCSVAHTFKMLVRPRNGSTTVVTDSTTLWDVPANTWTYIKAENRVATGTFTNVQMWAWPQAPGNAIAAGETFQYALAVIEFAPTVGDYFSGASAPALAVGYSPTASLSYGWSGTVNNSLSYEYLSVPLQDYQLQLAPGTIVGAGTAVGLKDITGLRSLPDLTDGDTPRGQSDGTLSGPSYLSSRRVAFNFEIFDPGDMEAAIKMVTRNFQNIRNASDEIMSAGEYLSNIATAGSKPVSSILVQLPGRAGPLMLLGRPSRLALPVDKQYSLRNPSIAAEWKVPDGVLYDEALQTGSCGLPNPVGGLTFPATPPFSFGYSSGGSVLLTNAGDYQTFAVIKITGPCTRPRVTLQSTGEYMSINLTLKAGDVLLIDMQNQLITFNGANRNNAVDVGSSFFDCPPGDSSFGFGSSDSVSVAGTMSVYMLNTYSAI